MFSNLARRIGLMANPDGPHNERDAADKQQFHIGRGRANAALLCRHHHTLIHQGHWQIRLGPDRTPELLPPTTHDPHQKPLRNTIHRPPTFAWPVR